PAGEPPVGQPARDGDDHRTEAEDETAGAKGGVERHDFKPRWGGGVIEARTTSRSAPARTGGPCRPSQMLLRPAHPSAVLGPSTGIVVRVSPHWLAKMTGMPRSCATRPGIDPESGPTCPKSQCLRPV